MTSKANEVSENAAGTPTLEPKLRRVLISLKEWFWAPDGNRYGAVWGLVERIGDVHSFNNGHVIVPNDQITTIVVTDHYPPTCKDVFIA